MTEQVIPAWSEPFVGEDAAGLTRAVRLDQIDRAWAFDGSTGRGVTVAIVDSGLEVGHPALQGRVIESIAVEMVDGEPMYSSGGGVWFWGGGWVVGLVFFLGLTPCRRCGVLR